MHGGFGVKVKVLVMLGYNDVRVNIQVLKTLPACQVESRAWLRYRLWSVQFPLLGDGTGLG